jgi:hypothetical protein
MMSASRGAILAWMALAVAGLCGYLWMRTRITAIPGDGRLYLAPGLAVAGTAVAAGLLCLRSAPRSDRTAFAELALVLLTGLVFRAVFLGLPPALSHDAYRYVWDAHLVAHGISPWEHTVDDPALAALRDRAIWPLVIWRNVPTIYPPGAQALFLLVHVLAPLNIGAMQVAMAVCDVLTCGLVIVLLRQLGLDPRRVVLYWWNPVSVLEFTFNAHVDAAATAFTVVALLAVVRARSSLGRALGGAALGFAALIKLYPLLYIVALVRRRDWPFLGGMLAALALVPLPFVRLGLGNGGFLGTYFAQRFVDQGLAFRLLTSLIPSAHLQTIAQLALLALGCAAVLWLRVRGWVDEIGALLAVAAAWLLVTPHFFPWYAGGVLPMVALSLGRDGAGRGAMAMALWLFALAAPFTYVVFSPHVNPNLFLLFYIVPLAVALVPHVRRLALQRVSSREECAHVDRALAIEKE